jgi:hypothetical protein
MPQDFFGYSRTVQPNGTLVSSEFATIAIGSGKTITVVQQVQAQYQQMVTPKFEAGSPTLYWLTGQPSGTVSFSRLISSSGFFSELSGLQNACGSLISVTLGLDGIGGCSAAVSPTGNNKAKFTGAVPESIQISWSAGTLEVSEGASIRVATLTSA